MIAGLLNLALRQLWPNAPLWLAPMLIELIPEIVELVKATKARQPDAPPQLIIDQIEVVLDVVLDRVPVLEDWTEEQRDALVGHLAAIARLVALTDTSKLDRRAIGAIRKGLRKARRG